MQRVPCKQRRHKGVRPNRPGQTQQQYQQQEGVRDVKEHIDIMGRAGGEIEQLAIQHVRHPGDRMPVGRVPGGESPSDAVPGKPVLHHRIICDVIVVIVQRESVMRHGQINRQHAQHEQQDDQAQTRH